ncbi:hypothetical protein BS50DRAFT_189063 [Corynespora cassiicola Philippines]|uniref:Uncharacterized protein n=1 Tax=Corynespora cassiicola Philippines TaxID=1448308 RepID=A0A2T2P7E1_CORCC|nr:hypothetical protein BS50DRAFT_189063 [Corynespora cassiicola Philippines]
MLQVFRRSPPPSTHDNHNHHTLSAYNLWTCPRPSIPCACVAQPTRSPPPAHSLPDAVTPRRLDRFAQSYKHHGRVTYSMVTYSMAHSHGKSLREEIGLTCALMAKA